MSAHYLGRSSAASVITRSCLLSWFVLGRNSAKFGDRRNVTNFHLPKNWEKFRLPPSFPLSYTPKMKRAVRSRRKVYGQLLKHARRQPHRECYGILAGQDGLITQVFPAKNVAAAFIRVHRGARRIRP